jgi:LacI family transcriptional regulator
MATERSTIGDVATRSGVSTATVSRVLSGTAPIRAATRDRVLAAVRDLAYRPSAVARALKRQATHTIGLVISDIQNPFYPEIVRAVEEAARERGWLVLLCTTGESAARQRDELELLLDRRVDGLIVAAGRLGRGHAAWLAGAPVPVVLVNCRARGTALASIQSDNRGGARAATRHLLELGHRRIGHISAARRDPAVGERLAGIRDALRGRVVSLPTTLGDGHVQGGERAARELLDAHPGLTAVLAHNDLTAIGALRAIRATGRRVPDDISLVGFDDIDLAGWLDPPLTTVRQQKTALGRWAVETLDGLSSGTIEREPAPRRLETSLVVRASTAPPPSAAQRNVPKEPRPTR